MPRAATATKSRKRFDKFPGDPEIPDAKSFEHVRSLRLKSDPDLIETLRRLMEERGYKTVPEAVRHLMYVGQSATPLDGEFRAAMASVKSQMIQYFTTRYWALLNQLIASFEEDWKRMDPNVKIEEEYAKIRAEQGSRP